MQFSSFDKYIRIYFPSNQSDERQVKYSDYHYFWLRHNCDCQPACRHEATYERIIDSSEVPLNITPLAVETAIINNERVLKIQWPAIAQLEDTDTVHTSIYEWRWLEKHAYAVNRQEMDHIPSDVTNVIVDYSQWLRQYADPQQPSKLTDQGQIEYRRKLGQVLKQHGLVVMKNRGLDTESIIYDLLPEGKEVVSTHFGRIEDLRTDNTTNVNTDQLGYTNAGVDLHTDQPFIEFPPGMQLLQSITPADEGGENYIVDSQRAALYLRKTDPYAFQLLSTIPVSFHRKQAKFESIQNRPIIELNKAGEIVQLRYSYFTYAPHLINFDLMEPYYRAYNTFAELVRDQKNQYRFLLNSGDAVLYDNWKCFHARTPFKGARHVRGVYFNIDDVHEHLFF